MDLSSLFGPPMVLFSRQQLEGVLKYFDGDVIGVIAENHGAGTVTITPMVADFEGARPIPSEGHAEADRAVVLDAYGNAYPVEGDDLEAAWAQAREGHIDLLEAEKAASEA